MKHTKIVYKDLSYKITGLCFKVHNELGRFCKEKQYAEKLEEYLKKEKMNFKREIVTNHIQKNSPTGNKIDFIIENQIIIELKAKPIIKEINNFIVINIFASLF